MVLSGAMLCSVCNVQAFAAEILYDQVTTETVTKGVTYQKNHRLTEEGWQDIHVLEIDLNDPNLSLQPLESQKEYGLKETLLNMVNDTGAAAAVNGDFFGLKGEYSASFGPVVRDGNIISAGTDKNLEKNEYSTFFIDKEGYVIVVIWRKSYIFLGYIIEMAKPDLKTVLKKYEIEYIEPNMADIDIDYINLITETHWKHMNLSKKFYDNINS